MIQNRSYLEHFVKALIPWGQPARNHWNNCTSLP